MKIDKNNWCINLKETPEGELKELFSENFLPNRRINGFYTFYGCSDGDIFCDDRTFDTPEITIDQWYNEIYLPEQKQKFNTAGRSVENSPYTNAVTQADLQQLEERLTKMFTHMLSTKAKILTEADEFVLKTLESYKPESKQELPPFPFWVEITKCINDDYWYTKEIGNKFKIIDKYNDGFKVDVGKYIVKNDCKILHDYKPEEKKPIWETHPDWESCRTNKVRFWWDDFGLLTFVGRNKCVYPFSEALAKRQVAEIKLMEIAEKWNEGVEIENDTFYLVVLDSDTTFDTAAFSQNDLLKFNIGFNSNELAEKSIELHKELWISYFMISE